ncbi:MAG: ATP-binding protein [Pseudomonadota bacterium]
MSFNKILKSILPRSLFYRSLLILTVPLILTITISTYIFFDRHWERMAGRLAFGVAAEIEFILRMVEQGIDQDQLDNLSKDSLESLQLNIQYKENTTIQKETTQYFGRGDVIKKFLYKELKKKIDNDFRIVVDVEEKWIQVQIQNQADALIVTLPERRLFSSSGYVFLIWMIGISTILMVVAIIFMRNQIRPIKKLAIAADRFGKGRDVPFYKPEGAREVRQAAKAFMGMRDRMQSQIEQRTFMLAGVSHDLRTPLTRLKLQAEMLPESEDKQSLQQDILDMEKMITAYLEFAKGEGSEDSERVELVEFIQRVMNNFNHTQANIEFVSVEEAIDFYLRPIAFERCLNNIISNAITYADTISISLRKDEDNVFIDIEDNGLGIDPSLYQDVFKPFYREEKSRNLKTGGVGLGLPISRDIILAHGGTIELDQSSKGGLAVKITLPF